MKSIYDPTFKYVPAAMTNIRETFKRIRDEQAQQAQAKPSNVQPLPRRKLDPETEARR